MEERQAAILNRYACVLFVRLKITELAPLHESSLLHFQYFKLSIEGLNCSSLFSEKRVIPKNQAN